jgi:hypothetical protein
LRRPLVPSRIGLIILVRPLMSRLAVFVIVFLVAPVFSFAQQSVDSNASAYIQNKNAMNFADWEGILFYCLFNDKLPTEMLRTVCERTSTNAKVLAASSKIDFWIAKDLIQLGVEATSKENLILLVELTGTRAAISATVKAYTEFSGPIKANRESKEGTIERRTNMRKGDLILWERNLVASGKVEELIVAVSQSIEVLLKEFFADYLNAQK